VELNGLSVKELQNIESQLEMSLRGIRMKRVIYECSRPLAGSHDA